MSLVFEGVEVKARDLKNKGEFRGKNTHLSEADFRRLGKGIDVYVETGIWKGDTLKVASRVFVRVIGIDILPYCVITARKRVQSAEILLGSSLDFLPKLCAEIKKPVFWYLDAHWTDFDPPMAPTPFVLWNELGLIRERTFPDVVVVDDVHTFGLKRSDVPEWEGVTVETIADCLGKEGFILGDCYVTRL